MSSRAGWDAGRTSRNSPSLHLFGKIEEGKQHEGNWLVGIIMGVRVVAPRAADQKPAYYFEVGVTDTNVTIASIKDEDGNRSEVPVVKGKSYSIRGTTDLCYNLKEVIANPKGYYGCGVEITYHGTKQFKGSPKPSHIFEVYLDPNWNVTGADND